MPYKNLPQFIKRLEELGEIRRIAVEVDPVFEITEIADRVSKSGGPALLFEKVKGSPHPLLINAFGSYARMQLALECDSFGDIAARIESLVKMQPPAGIMDKLRMLFTLKELAGCMPRKVKKAPCQERVLTGGPLLDTLPILTCWPHEGAELRHVPHAEVRQGIDRHALAVQQGRRAPLPQV
jgi:4-hydroxy-3-polyprenylbenzoate decarboxylase